MSDTLKEALEVFHKTYGMDLTDLPLEDLKGIFDQLKFIISLTKDT